MAEERPKWPESLPPPVEITESRRVDLVSGDLSTAADISGLASDLYWHSDDEYYLFFKHGQGIDGELLKKLEAQGIALRKTELYFYRHPHPTSDKDFVRILPGETKFEWQRETASGEMFGRFALTLESWRRKQLDASATGAATRRVIETRDQRPASEEVELEQKFQILRSAAQEQRDFERWTTEASGLSDYEIGVIFLDIDNFKQINARFTETVVDRTILPTVQELVRRICLHRATAYRHGGEELVVLLPNHALNEVIDFAERLRSAIEAHTFDADGQIVRLTTSNGVAAWPSHGNGLGEVLEAANRAEHAAKDQGKNRVCIAPGLN
jgi:diguanylate cyclase (GGDEF)-like protein